MQFPENVSVVVKNPVALSCETSGIPLPAVSWLKDGQPVKATSSVRILSGQFVFDHLSIEGGRDTDIVMSKAHKTRCIKKN